MIRNLRTGFSILALMVAAGAALADVLPLPRTPEFLIARVACAGLAVAVLLLLIFRKPDISPSETTALGPPIPKQPLKSEIADGYSAIMRSYSPATVGLFFNMLGNLPHYLTRINDHIEILEEAPQLRVTRRQCYQIDKDNGVSPQLLLVPLALIEKGVLIDNFAVKDSNNNDVPTLPYNHLRGLFAVTLEILVETAMRDREDGEVEEYREIDQEIVSKVLRDLAIAVCGPGPLDRLSGQNHDIAQAALKSIDELPISRKWNRDLRQFCVQYVDYYVIVAEVSPAEAGNYLELTYSHHVPLGIYNRRHWREQFGLKASTIDIPLHPYAFQVETYHQEIDAEPGQYIFDHHLERLKSQEHVIQKNLKTTDLAPYVRLYHDEARPNAHLYIRRQTVPQSPSVERLDSSSAETSPSEVAKREENLPGPLKSVIRLREIPPGVSGAATIISLSSAAIISFFALTHVGLDVDPNVPGLDAKQAEQIKATLNSDLPALLLALPAFVGVLIGSWLDLSRLRRASLTTYLALGGTMFLSLTSALYFVFDANRKLPTEITVPAIYDIKITTDWIWLVLMAAAITHFLFLLRTVIEESRHYTERILRRVVKQSTIKRIDKRRRMVYKWSEMLRRRVSWLLR